MDSTERVKDLLGQQLLAGQDRVRRQAARQRSGLSSTAKFHPFISTGSENPVPGPSRRLPELSRLPAGRRALGRGGPSALGRCPSPGAVPPSPPQEQLRRCGERLWAAPGVCLCVCEFVRRAAMWRWRFLLLPVLLAVLVSVRGQDDFSLEDAILGESTKKPLVTQKTPSSNKDDFDLSDAFDFGDSKPQPPGNPRETDNPKKDPPKESDKFDDLDLLDGGLPREGGSDGSGSNERKGPAPNSDQESEGSQGVLAGIISAVGATVVASVGSFIAYQKKKLCFKQSDEENVNMDSHRGAQSEPPVQRTLLEN
ncbi:CD99 antigen [Ammospiza caudacuta]|uniref:CD99 antigen n=1 Tax=Ammospiza caudacuta TaxID=2857398 RepID=UPI002738337B|nr:CD99 antigen [Ammospiza caudacuta]